MGRILYCRGEKRSASNRIVFVMINETHDIPVERHPLEPFLPSDGRILMLGSFPPPRQRWSMNFFYPNKQNDMWRIMGLLFFGDKDRFVRSDGGFDEDMVRGFCNERGIGLFDTACEVRRLNNDASDKFLVVARCSDVGAMLAKMPRCGAVVVTGQKALDTLLSTVEGEAPSIGSFMEVTIGDRKVRLYRMPSTSRAYPLAIGKKAESYRVMFENEGLIPAL